VKKQKMPDRNGEFTAINFSKSDARIYTELSSDHPIDLCRYQVANCYMGRLGLINSGGESKGETGLLKSIKSAVINKRAGGTGLILGRKAFQRPFIDGVKFLEAIQDVYLEKEIDLAQIINLLCLAMLKTKYNKIRNVAFACDLENIHQTVPSEQIKKLVGDIDARLFGINVGHDDGFENIIVEHETLHTLFDSTNTTYCYDADHL
jgi:hypothetical protein